MPLRPFYRRRGAGAARRPDDDPAGLPPLRPIADHVPARGIARWPAMNPRPRKALLNAALAEPRSVSTDGLTVTQHSISELIEAQRYIANLCPETGRSGRRGIRFSGLDPRRHGAAPMSRGKDSPILGADGTPFRAANGRTSHRINPSIRSRYDSAQISDETRRHWAEADSLSARAANREEVRRRLRERRGTNFKTIATQMVL